MWQGLNGHMSLSIHDCPLRRISLGRSGPGPTLGFRSSGAVGAEKGVGDSTLQATARVLSLTWWTGRNSPCGQRGARSMQWAACERQAGQAGTVE